MAKIVIVSSFKTKLKIQLLPKLTKNPIHRNIHLPTYSPNLNPIERLWKSIKTVLAETGFIENLQHLNQQLSSHILIVF